MVFYDKTGRRQIIVWLLGLATLSLCGLFFVGAYVALITTPAMELLPYTSHSEDSTLYSKTIALTFDDGPHPTYTPELIEVLKENNVPASFFFIGENVLKHPTIARNVVENGFEIGNHTFTHSEHVGTSASRLRNELVATERAIRSATGRETRLFRPPYLEDVDVGEFDGGKISGEEIRWAEETGYIVVGANLDTQDWNVQRGEADIIMGRLTEGVRDDRPIVIIMHDSAGEGATIEAMRRFIPEMKSQGYRFVYVSEYFGLTPSQVMPLASAPTMMDNLLVQAASAVVTGLSAFDILIMCVSVIGLTRIWMLILTRRLVPFFERRPLPRFFRGHEPLEIPTVRGALVAHATSILSHAPITVIIPAYNEEANIEATVRSVIKTTAVPAQVIVVNDGSTDRTGEILENQKLIYGDRLIVLHKQNGGSKAGALNYALPYAHQDILVCIDADTIVQKDAFSYLTAHFDDPRIGAVAGKVYPASTETLFAAFQYIEYMQGQNFEKSVLALTNGIGVVPGAIGAWRKSAIEGAGNYSTETVVEDQDLTLALLSKGFVIAYEPRAVAYTETPDSLRSFFRQRSRWIYGTIQCLWKYRTMFFSIKRPVLGWIILPSSALFNLLIPALVPIVDAGLVIAFFSGVDLTLILWPFLIYTAFDLWCAIEGIAQERDASARLIPLIILQRFFYRYVLAVAILRSCTQALFGKFVGWGSQERRGECHEALRSLTIPALGTDSRILTPPSPAH